jgi:electron transfer flavoprotein beta subunit
MNIIVCVKQVPDTTEIKIDPVKNTLIRDGVPAVLNPFDGYALEAACRMKDQNPDVNLIAVSMGPPQAKAVLKECLAAGCDKAYLISGRAFGGSDTLATSYIIASAVKEIAKKEGPIDIICCGKQAIDGDTAQVGPEMAEHLGLPQVTYGLEAEITPEMVKVKKEVYDGIEVIGVKMPCLLTFTKPAWDPRKATLLGKIKANRTEINVISDAPEDIPDIDRERIGLKGSPTKVQRTFVPQPKSGGLKIKEATVAESVNKLMEELEKASLV